MKKFNIINELEDEHGNMWELAINLVDKTTWLFINGTRCGIVKLNYEYITNSEVNVESIATIEYVVDTDEGVSNRNVVLDFRNNKVVNLENVYCTLTDKEGRKVNVYANA